MSKLNDFMLQFGIDKFLHFVGGACVMTITNSWIMLITVSIGKEAYDHAIYGGADPKDALATFLGGVFGLIAAKLWLLLPFTLI